MRMEKRDTYTEDEILNDPKGIGMLKTSRRFITAELKRHIIPTIEAIEGIFHKVLVGERVFLDKPYQDWKDMPNLQVIYMVHTWKAGILARYPAVVVMSVK